MLSSFHKFFHAGVITYCTQNLAAVAVIHLLNVVHDERLRRRFALIRVDHNSSDVVELREVAGWDLKRYRGLAGSRCGLVIFARISLEPPLVTTLPKSICEGVIQLEDSSDQFKLGLGPEDRFTDIVSVKRTTGDALELSRKPDEIRSLRMAVAAWSPERIQVSTPVEQQILDLALENWEVTLRDMHEKVPESLFQTGGSSALRLRQLRPWVPSEVGHLSLMPLLQCRMIVVCSSVLYNTIAQLELLAFAKDEIENVLLRSSFNGQIGLGQDSKCPGSVWVYFLSKL
jgi:hypothetical protein